MTAVKVLGIAITHPDKVLWPKSPAGEAVTKEMLARYLAAAASRILPHIAGRPISVLRAPDGIGGQTFFQRHPLAGLAAPILSIKVKGEAKPYFGIANARALIALGQQAVLEIHPWGSRKGDPESPERIVFDLDPAPGLPFVRVIEAAREIRRRLRELGFKPFVKTTGGKGLHVVIAIRPGSRWSDAKAFARTIAEEVAAAQPDRYTTTLSKAARNHRVFIDYLRNDRTATAVAPWSPRARPGCPIAVPLSWSELRDGFDPHAFTIHTIAKRLERTDPWAALARSARALPNLSAKPR